MIKLNRERMLDDMHKRFRHWMDMYTDKNVSDETLYLELCASIYSGSKEDDFVDEVYQYDAHGGCYFKRQGIVFTVADIRDMRKNPDTGNAAYYDICILICDHRHEEDMNDKDACTWYHMVGGPECYLYGSSGPEFEAGKPVHGQFIEAADAYIDSIGLEKLRKLQESE